MFWNEIQKTVLDSLQSGAGSRDRVLLGDFGGGKTSTMVEGAIQSAQGAGRTFFMTALDGGVEGEESVMGVALVERFAGTGVQVVTPKMMREHLGRRQDADVLALIRDFVRAEGDPLSAKVMYCHCIYI